MWLYFEVNKLNINLTLPAWRGSCTYWMWRTRRRRRGKARGWITACSKTSVVRSVPAGSTLVELWNCRPHPSVQIIVMSIQLIFQSLDQLLSISIINYFWTWTSRVALLGAKQLLRSLNPIAPSAPHQPYPSGQTTPLPTPPPLPTLRLPYRSL